MFNLELLRTQMSDAAEQLKQALKKEENLSAQYARNPQPDMLARKTEAENAVERFTEEYSRLLEQYCGAVRDHFLARPN